MLHSIGLQTVGYDWVTELKLIDKEQCRPFQFWSKFILE